MQPSPPPSRRALGQSEFSTWLHRLVVNTWDATGLPIGTAKCYAHRGHSRLRARLSA